MSPSLRASLAPNLLRRAVIVALIVGSVLNFINQGDRLLAGQALVLWKLGLTYCVPFCVTWFGAYSAIRAMERREPELPPNDLAAVRPGAEGRS